MLLFPDQRVEQPDNDTCSFAGPVDKCDWVNLHARAKTLPQTGMKYIIFVDDEAYTCSIYFMRNRGEVTDRVCLILRDLEDADLCLESAAWIRITENYPGMIYIIRGITDADKWQTYNAAIGSPEDSVCMLDFDLQQCDLTP